MGKPASDQVLIFVSLDKENPYNIGAEIEVTLKDDKYLICEPTCVIIPEGVEHGPIVTKKVDRTYGFYSIGLTREPV
jgi:hypothetical protein